MSKPTRLVLLGACGVLFAGLAVGAVAFVQGGFSGQLETPAIPDELRYFPSTASVVAYADVRGVMASDVRQRFRDSAREAEGQREFESRTGIDLERDVDQVVACLIPGVGEPDGLVVATGRFQPDRLEQLAQEHGGTAEEYRGVRVISRPTGDRDLAMAFLEPGVLALGSTSVVRQAVDAPGTDVTSNERLMGLMTEIDGGSNAWLIARMDDPDALSWLPDRVQTQVPPLEAFAIGSRLNGGLSGRITAEGRDEQATQNLTDVVQGFLALARMQTGSRPELASVLDGFELSRTERRVILSFNLPPDVFQTVTPAR